MTKLSANQILTMDKTSPTAVFGRASRPAEAVSPTCPTHQCSQGTGICPPPISGTGQSCTCTIFFC